MMFVIRAAFWLAIVSVFVPADFAGAQIDMPFEINEATTIDLNADGWCADNAEICRAGEEALEFGGFLADIAVDRIDAAIEAHNAQEG